METVVVRSYFKLVGFLFLIGLLAVSAFSQDEDNAITGIQTLWSQQVDVFTRGSAHPECQEAKSQIQKYFLENATSRTPEIAVAYILLGTQALEEKKWEDAQWAFLAALEFDPFSVRASQYALINSRHLGLTNMASMLVKHVLVVVKRAFQPGIYHLIFGNAADVLRSAFLLAAFVIILVVMIKLFSLVVHQCSDVLPFTVDPRIIAAGLILLLTSILASPLGLVGFTLLILLLSGLFAEKQYRTAIWISWLLISALFPLSLISAHAMVTENNRLFSVIRYATTGGYSEPAIAELKLLLEETPDSDEDTISKIHYLMGSLYKRGGFYTDAQQEFELYKTMMPRDSAVYINLGNIDFVNDRYQAAIENYRRAENIDPQNPIIFFNLSKANLALFRFDEARNMQNQASRLNPDLTSKLNLLYGSDLIRMVADAGVPKHWLTKELNAGWSKALQSLPEFWHAPLVDIPLKKAVLGWIFLTILLVVLNRLAVKYRFSRFCLKCRKPMKPNFDDGTERICPTCHRIYLRKTTIDKSSTQKKEEKKDMSWYDRLFSIALSIFIPGGGKVYSGYMFFGILAILSWSVVMAYFLSPCRTFDSFLRIPAIETEPGNLFAWIVLCGLYGLSIIQAFREKTE